MTGTLLAELDGKEGLALRLVSMEKSQIGREEMEQA